MCRIATFVVLAMIALSVTGCGTVCNFATGHPVPYGGVKRDLDFPTNDMVGVGAEGAVWLAAAWLADLCACGVADTATYPLVLWHSDWTARRDHHTPATDHGYSARLAAQPSPPVEHGGEEVHHD